MDILKQTRGHLKGAITRLHNFASSISPDMAVALLEIRLERLTDSWKEFCASQREYFKFHDQEAYGDPESEFEGVELKYIAAKAILVEAIRERKSSASVDTRTKPVENVNCSSKSAGYSAPENRAEVELPILRLEPFSGDYREWPGFRDMFLGSIDCKSHLSGAQKFRYLKSFLRDEASRLLSHLDISDSNYEQAWEKLERRYDKPMYMINAYIDNFLKLPSVEGVHLRKLVDNADEILRGLTALKCESRDPWLVFIMLNKTDAETRKAWALEGKNSDSATVYDLLNFLENRCSALEASEVKPKGSKSVSRITNNIKSLAVAKVSCPKCRENHHLPLCPQFVSMSVPSRRIFVRDEKLCYNCLGTKHTASRCRVRDRCSRCQSRHHSLVHLEQPTLSKNENFAVKEEATTSCTSEKALPILSNHALKDNHVSGILPTIVVNVTDSSGRLQSCRLLLDTGSQVSFVTDSCVRRLGLRRQHARRSITGISSLEAGVTQGMVLLNLCSRHDSSEIRVQAYILKSITSHTPMVPFAGSDALSLQGLHLADPHFNTPGPIDILLGSDIVWNVLRDGRRLDTNGKLIAQNTVFGWVITGNMPGKEVVALRAEISSDLDWLLKLFWEIEEIPNTHAVQEDNLVDTHFAETFSRSPDNKYIVELPFRQPGFAFANTLSGALSRLAAMERRFTRDDNLRKEYHNFMSAYEELGHMERIPEDEIEPTSGQVFYLPHHAVITNKLRVVFDGSHKDTNGVSLNAMLYSGPPLQRNLASVCLRFRLPKYVFCADIIKMFRQIWVKVEHRDFQRIAWRKSPSDSIGHYRLRTVTYGTTSAPYAAIRVLRQLALDYQFQFPLASNSILKDFYVDDLLTGANSVADILALKEQLVELLSCGGFELSKWSSNCWPVLNMDSNSNVSLDLDDVCTKVLGLFWNPYSDVLSFKLSLQEVSLPTKRKLLSEVSKIFDPLGFLSPVTILFKIMFQELWMLDCKLGWDDPLPNNTAEKWDYYRKNLGCLEDIKIARRCITNHRHFELLGFSDASEKAYSAAVYTRSTSKNGIIEVHLVAAKTRVAPVKQLTIPQLELCGALLLARLIKLVTSSWDDKPSRVFAFCDSRIVLAWLSSPPRKWNTFVANRTSEILDTLPRSVWNHIRSEENPADCASRGIEPSKLLSLELWWKGPAWATGNTSKWPMSSNIIVDNVPEERKAIVQVNTLCSVVHVVDILAEKVSSWTRIVRIVAFIRRFISNSRKLAANRQRGYLRTSEILEARSICLLHVQNDFAEEILALKARRPVSQRSKLSSLCPFLDEEGLLRVGGRISNASEVPFNIKHPIILPKGHPVTKLILREAHVRFLHPGVSALFSLIRQEFWILGCRNMIRKIVHDCVQCFRLRQQTSTQLMGNLPPSRVTASYAFSHTGVDYAGPITLRLCRGRKSKFTKGYLAIFVCMSTKAIHLEAVSDLSTESFLAALRRFIARRGKCTIIYSDNGSNFRGAARKLSDLYAVLKSQDHIELVSSTLAADQIRWEFIPPHSPHFGGLWESGVKCVKQHLRRVIGNTILTFEELATLLAQIEALLNSRPLCAISDSDLNPLTPSHFLIGRPYTAVPEPSYLEVPINRLGRWQLLQNMTQGFWRRWYLDYLTTLQQRPKWRKPTPDLKIGQLVVVKEPNLPPSKWLLGRVQEVHTGGDGYVRVATIQTSTTVLRRPITKLSVLPCS